MVDITVAKPFYSVLILAFGCSLLVAGAAVGLRPKQEANKELDRQLNILYAAGLYEEGKSVQDLFSTIETRMVELESGNFIENDRFDTATYNQRKAALSKDFGRDIPSEKDLAKLGRQEKYSLVYLVKENEKLSQVILPVRGKGLWSTMYAYVALEGDLTTIRGVSFYEHGETPGLGGEVENRRWQDGWSGKQLYNPDGEVTLQVVKPTGESSDNLYQIDGLSGATLTSQGVGGLLEFWFGDHGFKPFLARISSDKGTQ